MWPKLRNAFRKFFTDEEYFTGLWDRWVAKVRGVLMAAGAAIAVYGDQLAAALPGWAGRIKVGGIVLMGVSLMLRAGDRTPENVKALAAQQNGGTQ